MASIVDELNRVIDIELENYPEKMERVSLGALGSPLKAFECTSRLNEESVVSPEFGKSNIETGWKDIFAQIFVTLSMSKERYFSIEEAACRFLPLRGQVELYATVHASTFNIDK